MHDIDAVNNGSLQRVVRDKILVEEGQRLRDRRCRHANHSRRIKVRDNLPPALLVVNGAMAFVNDDEVKEVMGKLGVVRQLDFHAFSLRSSLVLFLLGIVGLITRELRVKPLDRADDNPCSASDGVGCQLFHTVDVREGLTALGQRERLKCRLC